MPREKNGECGALIRMGLNADLSAVIGYDLLANSQTHAASVVLLTAVKALEWPKNLFRKLRVKTDALIRDCDLPKRVPRLPALDEYGRRLIRFFELYRV